MTTQTAIEQTDPAQVLERVIISGDLSVLTPKERVNYYNEVCRSMGLNPFTKPLDYLRLNNKLTLYATKNATDQLRRLHGISVTQLEHTDVQGVHVVTAYGKDQTGRIDSAQGAVYTKNLQGDELANGLMKAETKAKRRLTLSMCGLGFMDATEVDTVADAQTVNVDHTTGEVLDERNMIRNADERVWQRYVQVLSEAQDLGLNPKPLRLPIDHGVLVGEGRNLLEQIHARRAEVEGGVA